MKHEITAEEVKFAINAKELNRIFPPIRERSLPCDLLVNSLSDLYDQRRIP